ncbi:Os09g0119701 [Oryza sativa Japonica Group]|uniref:Os09g0119701 protein n=1 Tax=Oryza sativa subsp. japonica TaxID=39947 RepID=A0A0P0XJY1_ORYSJ|nr:Os09g0119701 [Oryza sativa Japonica Group]
MARVAAADLRDSGGVGPSGEKAVTEWGPRHRAKGTSRRGRVRRSGKDREWRQRGCVRGLSRRSAWRCSLGVRRQCVRRAGRVRLVTGRGAWLSGWTGQRAVGRRLGALLVRRM